MRKIALSLLLVLVPGTALAQHRWRDDRWNRSWGDDPNDASRDVSAPWAGDCQPETGNAPVAAIDDAVRGANRPVYDTMGDQALKNQLHDQTTRGQHIDLTYSQARQWLFAHSLDSKGYVWDVYGQREAHTSGSNPDVNDINVEHTWPQSRFHTGWSGQGKHQDDDPMKADLHNLYATDNHLNGERANKPFADLGCAGTNRACNSDAAFEPPDAQKGNVARAIFYFSVRYGMPVPNDMEQTLKRWNQLDPPDASEHARNDAIEQIQGNRNPFIDDASLVGRISDF